MLISYWERSSCFQSSPSEQSHRVDGRVPVGAGGRDSPYLEPLGCVIPEGLLQPSLSFPVSPQQLIHLLNMLAQRTLLSGLTELPQPH